MSVIELINNYNTGSFFDYTIPAKSYQITFQEPVTPVMNGLLDLHDYVFFFMVVVLSIVLVLLVQIVQIFSSNNNENKSLKFFEFSLLEVFFLSFYKNIKFLKTIYYFIFMFFSFLLWFFLLIKTFFNLRSNLKKKSWLSIKKTLFNNKSFVITKKRNNKIFKVENLIFKKGIMSNNLYKIMNNSLLLEKNKESIVSFKTIINSFDILEKTYFNNNKNFFDIRKFKYDLIDLYLLNNKNNLLNNYIKNNYDFFSIYLDEFLNRKNSKKRFNSFNYIYFSLLNHKQKFSIKNFTSIFRKNLLNNFYNIKFFNYYNYYFNLLSVILKKNNENFINKSNIYIKDISFIYKSLEEKKFLLNQFNEKSNSFLKKNKSQFNLFNLESIIGNFLFNTFLNSLLMKLYGKIKIGYFNHSTRLEIIWTIIPILIIGLIITPSFFFMYAIDEDMESLLTIRIIGHQWYWSYVYALPSYLMGSETLFDHKYSLSHTNSVGSSNIIPTDRKYFAFDSYMSDNMIDGSPRLLCTDTLLFLPKFFHINCIVTSTDVLHSWALPALGVKIDAVPGRLNRTDIFLEHEGMFFGQCSESCGVNHSFMPIQIQAVSLSSFIKFLSGIF